ncbi:MULTISPECIES: DUF805 domain-containing protein [Lactobacillaceae]|uniref:DUF805 domain-containing protein n=1 Tax=Lactobacillaceae TaxID=33958 RepID=UPI0014573E98|nr:DUF805 domain-containing protein [Lactobacillus sp. HBUAS51381]NLR09413.1 DUF805 domain-containing protein [Lactobacillus sp. HBUAS51381]
MKMALKKFWLSLFDFSGEATRQEFWWPVGMNYLIGILVIVRLALFKGYSWLAILTVQMPALRLTGRLILMAVWLLLLSVKVRRLHDLNRSGWWVLLNLVPVVGAVYMTVIGLLPSRVQVRKYVAQRN